VVPDAGHVVLDAGHVVPDAGTKRRDVVPSDIGPAFLISGT
jgi:hypothetical protein